MITSEALCAKFRQALEEGWGYIYGKSGQTWTKAAQDRLAAVYASDPKQYADYAYSAKYGEKWIGRRVADCSGLFVWAVKELGGSVPHGSNAIWHKSLNRWGSLRDGARTDGQALRAGSAVFKYSGSGGWHHVGLYVGEGRVVEAKGTKAGVVESPLGPAWTFWGELGQVDYGGEQPAYTGPGTVQAASGRTVNLRSEPGGKILTRVPVGSAVTVNGEKDGWDSVIWTQTWTGWMKKEYIGEGEA